MVDFKGVPVATKEEVEDVVLIEFKTIMGGIDKQIKALFEMLMLHLAEHNKLSYEFCNVEGVTNKETADKKFVQLHESIWKARNVLVAEASQIVKDNDLK